VLPCPAGVNQLDQRRARVEGSNDAGGGMKGGEGKRKCPGLVGAVLGRARGREEGEGEGEEEAGGGSIGAAAAGGRRVVLEGRK